MKKIFLLLFIASLCLGGNAQGTLQFNQAKAVTMNLGYNTYVNIGTVPAGKVWKIENVVSNVIDYYTFRINGSTIIPIPLQYSTSNTSMNNNAIWLPAGTVLDIWSSYNNTPYPGVLVNILEFNIQ